MSLLDNPVVLGLVLYLLTIIIKKAGWVKDSKETLWLVMGASFVIGFLDLLAVHGFTWIPAMPAFTDPVTIVLWLGECIKVMASNAGGVLMGSQVIYHLLQGKLVAKRIGA